MDIELDEGRKGRRYGEAEDSLDEEMQLRGVHIHE
jgi:hypothetical protein